MKTTLKAALLLALVLPGPAMAQTAERIREQPRTHWASRGRAALQLNAAMMRTAVAPQTTPLEGALRQVMIPVAFADEPLAYAPATIADRFYGAGTPERYTLPGYYSEMSGGRFTIDGTVAPPVQLTRTSASYVGARSSNLYGGVADDLATFVKDVLEIADRQVDWRAFVGPGENTVPAVVIVTAGRGGHCTGDASHIWPHRWHATGLFGAPFATSRTTADGQTILIEDYIIQGSEECAGGLAEIGIVAHETGHLLGLPDLYNTRDGGATSPVGHWDLMATGNYNSPSSPAALGAWSRTHLGWASVVAADGQDTASFRLAPVARTGEVLRLPLQGSGEYVLVENRRRIGADQHAHGEGLLVWYVDADAVGARMAANTLNDDLNAPAVAVVAADGRRDMEDNVNDGDAGDVWVDAALVNGFGRGMDRPVPARSGEVAWSIADLSWHAGMTAELTVRPEAADPLDYQVQPAVLGPFMAGTQVDVQFRLAPDVVATWSAEASELAALGLTLTDAGRLHGQLTEAPGSYSLTVKANAGTDVGATYQVEVLERRAIDGAAVARALLGGPALDPETSALLDAAGNRNGRLDSGDIVLAVRSGLIDIATLRIQP